MQTYLCVSVRKKYMFFWKIFVYVQNEWSRIKDKRVFQQLVHARIHKMFCLQYVIHENGHIREKSVAWLPNFYIVDEVMKLSFVIFQFSLSDLHINPF